MKTLLTTILFILFTFPTLLHGQEDNCHIMVYDGNYPIEFAYIFINGKYYSSTDSLGVTSISNSYLKIGDTLSVSYVGMNCDKFVYDGKKQHKFNMQSNFTLTEVNKTASIKSFFQFYKRNAKILRPFTSRYKFSYNISVYKNEKSSVLLVGDASLSKICYLGNYQIKYKMDKLHITKGDSTGLKAAVSCLAYSYHLLFFLNYVKINHVRMHSLKYMGETKEHKIFVWHFNAPKGLPAPQLIVYANKTTKSIDKTESAYIHVATKKLVNSIMNFGYNKKEGTFLKDGYVYAHTKGYEDGNYSLITVVKK